MEFCGCSLRCPGGQTGDIAKEADVGEQNGLGQTKLLIPTHYIASSWDDYNDNGGDYMLTGEAVLESTFESCPSSTVGTNSVGSHLDTVYECCKEDTLSTVLSNSYALAGLMMQASVYLIWFLVVPGYKKAFKYKEAAPDKYEEGPQLVAEAHD